MADLVIADFLSHIEEGRPDLFAMDKEDNSLRNCLIASMRGILHQCEMSDTASDRSRTTLEHNFTSNFRERMFQLID